MNDIILLALAEEAPGLSQYGNVFFTGVGKVNAAMTTAELIERHKPKRVINFGTAGGITVGTGLHLVSRYVQRDMVCCELGSKPGQTPFEDLGVVLDLGGDGLTCSTGDNFVTNPELEIPADIVDMEAYAIAKTCYRKGVEFVCYKFVSDSANEHSYRDWREMVSAGESLYIEKLKEYDIIIL